MHGYLLSASAAKISPQHSAPARNPRGAISAAGFCSVFFWTGGGTVGSPAAEDPGFIRTDEMTKRTEMIGKWCRALVKALMAPGHMFCFILRLSRLIGGEVDEFGHGVSEPGRGVDEVALVDGGRSESGATGKG